MGKVRIVGWVGGSGMGKCSLGWCEGGVRDAVDQLGLGREVMAICGVGWGGG